MAGAFLDDAAEASPDRARTGVDDDAVHMAHALALGRRGLGLTAPNPSVGCVLVKDGIVVGRGVTQPGGRPHGETVALAQAGERARGATAYVTLEPCSHYGRTGPCVDALARAGIARVVCALGDPDPRVSGRGFAMLRSYGLQVEIGLGAREAALAHRGHVSRIRLGRPFVQLKMAETADGFIAGPGGARRAITGAAANAEVHRMRASVEAILVGVGTVRADDPLLTVRLPGLEDRSPDRFIIDPRLSTPRGAQVERSVQRRPGPLRRAATTLLAAEDAPADREQELTACGVEVFRLARRADGTLDLADGLRLLGALGYTRVLVEGGVKLATNLIASGICDEFVRIVSPDAIGAGLPGVPESLRASTFTLAETAHFGRDRLEIWR